MLLFGDSYTMDRQESGWTFIRNDFDDYLGWINSKQVQKLQKEPETRTACAGYPFIRASHNSEFTFILAGSTIPDLSGTSFSINNTTYELDFPNVSYKPSDISYLAKEYLNTPYLWGGRSPFGIDCSGFTQAVYKICGTAILRDAYQQATMGEQVSFLEQALPGDLAFFDNDAGNITHVGILLSSDKIIHASGKVRIDTIDQHGIYNRDENHYSHKLRIIKRIM